MLAMKKLLFILPVLGISLSSCGIIEETKYTLESNRAAVDMSTQVINENTQAIEQANVKIEENRRQLEQINATLKKASAS
jgi:hypothetical protein